MDFYNGKDLIQKCKEENLPISSIMELREITTGSLTKDEVDSKTKLALSIKSLASSESISGEIKKELSN